jgi:hypothetical protein
MRNNLSEGWSRYILTYIYICLLRWHRIFLWQSKFRSLHLWDSSTDFTFQFYYFICAGWQVIYHLSQVYWLISWVWLWWWFWPWWVTLLMIIIHIKDKWKLFILSWHFLFFNLVGFSNIHFFYYTLVAHCISLFKISLFAILNLVSIWLDMYRCFVLFFHF